MINLMIKAFIIGSTMMVPGVSGGSMAMILALYDKLIYSIASFFKDIKGNLKFLSIFIVFSLLGIVFCSKYISIVIERYEAISYTFFIGLVCGALPMLLKKAEIKKFNIKYVLYFLIGLSSLILLDYLPSVNSQNLSPYWIFFTGVIVSIGFILPGISTSYLLLVLGVYEFAMNSISNYDIVALIPLLLGFAIGVLTLTKILSILLEKLPTFTYILIIGFLVGSLKEIIPSYTNIIEILISILSFIIGAIAIYFITVIEEKKAK